LVCRLESGLRRGMRALFFLFLFQS
jgi:hypothetical protein